MSTRANVHTNRTVHTGENKFQLTFGFRSALRARTFDVSKRTSGTFDFGTVAENKDGDSVFQTTGYRNRTLVQWLRPTDSACETGSATGDAVVITINAVFVRKLIRTVAPRRRAPNLKTRCARLV